MIEAHFVTDDEKKGDLTSLLMHYFLHVPLVQRDNLEALKIVNNSASTAFIHI